MPTPLSTADEEVSPLAAVVVSVAGEPVQTAVPGAYAPGAAAAVRVPVDPGQTVAPGVNAPGVAVAVRVPVEPTHVETVTPATTAAISVLLLVDSPDTSAVVEVDPVR